MRIPNFIGFDAVVVDVFPGRKNDFGLESRFRRNGEFHGRIDNAHQGVKAVQFRVDLSVEPLRRQR